MKYLTFIILLSVLVFGSELSFGQSIQLIDTTTAAEVDAKKAVEYYTHGLALMKKSNFKGAIESFADAVDLDSNKIIYQYQLGLAYYYSRNYKTAIDVMKRIILIDPKTDRYYQLMGQAYQELREPNKAYKIYLDGLKAIPCSGPLNCELGRIEYEHKNFNLALQYWENGILCDPNYPSNYYYAAKAYARTSEKIWSLIYGEIFINIEISSPRTYEMSKIMFEVYKRSIYIKNERNKYLFFSDVPLHLSSKMMKDTMLLHKNFEQAYTVTGRKCLNAFKRDFNLPELIQFRRNFVMKWYEKNFPTDYPNALFDYQRTVISSDYNDCYNYWLFNRGDIMQFNLWYERNSKRYEEFLVWLKDHPLEVNNENVVSRMKMISRNEPEQKQVLPPNKK